MRVLIYANPKSGSTALAFHLKASLPGHALVFEPRSLAEVSADEPNLVAKYFWREEDDDGDDGLDPFDKRILLVRHPLDTLLSSLIHALSTSPRVVSDAFARDVVEKFHQLEAGLISVRDLYLYAREALERPGLVAPAMAAISARHRARNGGYFFPMRYEDLIAERFEALSEHLGTPVAAGRIDPPFRYVARTKAAGNWTSWLTREDVNYFRAERAVSEYAELFGYDLNLPNNARLHRDPQEGSVYVRKQIDRIRKRHGAGPLSLGPSKSLTDSHLMKAADALSKGDMEAAMAWANRAVLGGSPHPMPLILVARGLIGQGDFEGAEAAARRAVEIAPWYVTGWRQLSDALFRQKRLDEAAAAAEEAIRGEPGNADHHTLRATIKMAARDWPEAEISIRKALACDNHIKTSHKSLALVLWELGRPAEALEEINLALAHYPDIWHVNLLKGTLCLDLGQYDDAAASLAAARADPEHDAKAIANFEARLRALEPTA